MEGGWLRASTKVNSAKRCGGGLHSSPMQPLHAIHFPARSFRRFRRREIPPPDPQPLNPSSFKPGNLSTRSSIWARSSECAPDGICTQTVHTVLALSPQPPRFLVVAEGRLVQRSANAGLRQEYPDNEREEIKGRGRKRCGSAKDDPRFGWVGVQGRPVGPRSFSF